MTLRARLRRTRAYVERTLSTTIQNRRFVRGDQRFLVVRHPYNNASCFDVLLHWLEAFPEVRARFELQLLTHYIDDLSRYVLHIPWLQDPVEHWSLDAYWQARRLADRCDRRAIPVINRVDRLTNAAKSTGARLIAGTGLRTPRTHRIDDPTRFRETRGGLALPMFVREDWGHGGRMCRADTDAELRSLPIESFARPLAIELCDVRDPRDNLHRKYRYVVAGDVGVSLSMHVQKDWIVRGTQSERNDALIAEEIEYLERANPHHAQFVLATRVLGLDFAAFDYSYDSTGSVIVWEANPFPVIQFGGVTRAYRRDATTRVLAAMVRHYHVRAGLAVPPAITASMPRSPA